MGFWGPAGFQPEYPELSTPPAVSASDPNAENEAEGSKNDGEDLRSDVDPYSPEAPEEAVPLTDAERFGFPKNPSR